MKVVCLCLLVALAYGLPANQPASATDATALEAEVNLAQLGGGYVRSTVDQTKCPNLCSGRGNCVVNNDPAAPPENTTICICDKGWTGYDCSTVMLIPSQRDDGADCPNHCSSHGVCYRGSSVVSPRCYCDHGWTGIDCASLREDVVHCPNNCSGFGVCTSGYSQKLGNVVARCLCDANHDGDDCSTELKSTCPNACSRHGKCTKDGCQCEDGWQGLDCSLHQLPECPNNCSSHGRCFQGQCYCSPGFSGKDCSQADVLKCPNDCSGHGRCHPGTSYFPGGCLCEPEWQGADCSFPKQHLPEPECPSNCSGNGFCRQDSLCECYAHWFGAGCEFPEPPVDAPSMKNGDVFHPYYMSGKILRLDPDDRTKVIKTNEHPGCLNNCTSHGICLEILLDSKPTWDKDGNTIVNGDVALGGNTRAFVCKCDPGFLGEDCSHAPPANMGTQVVTPGAPMQMPEPPVNSDAPKQLFQEDNTSWEAPPSMQLLKLKAQGCPANCSSRGRCIRNKDGIPECSCYPGWDGRDCSKKVPMHYHCPLDCGPHGRCVTASQYFPVHCLCEADWMGANCDHPRPKKVTFEVAEGFCENHCSYRGPCVNGSCVCLEMGWGGKDCSVQAGGECKDNCNGNGVCFWGTCECLGGFTGETCDVHPPAPCPNDCNMKGKCVGGTCICLSGYTGNDCSDIMVECPNHCSGHGECIPANRAENTPAFCECAEGYTGLDCSNFPKGLEIVPPQEPTAAQAEAQEQADKQALKKSTFDKLSAEQ